MSMTQGSAEHETDRVRPPKAWVSPAIRKMTAGSAEEEGTVRTDLGEARS